MRVSYGYIEVDPTVRPALRIIQSAWNPYTPPVIHTERSFRKRRYETWWENGQKVGRWDWVSADYSEQDATQ